MNGEEFEEKFRMRKVSAPFHLFCDRIIYSQETEFALPLIDSVFLLLPLVIHPRSSPPAHQFSSTLRSGQGIPDV